MLIIFNTTGMVFAGFIKFTVASTLYETHVTKMYCFNTMYYDKSKKESWASSAWDALNKAQPDKAAGNYVFPEKFSPTGIKNY